MLSAATNYDSQFVSASARIARKISNTELGGSDFVIDSPSTVTEYVDYEVGASATTLLEKMTNRGNSNPGSYLHSEDFSSLNTEERYLWRKITPNMKSIILKGRNINNRTNNRFNSNTFNNPSCKNDKPPFHN